MADKKSKKKYLKPEIICLGDYKNDLANTYLCSNGDAACPGTCSTGGIVGNLCSDGSSTTDCGSGFSAPYQT
jgi:hypothetical protein